jgi:hypothetical protein
LLAFKKYSLLLLFSTLLLATSVADMFVNGRQFSEMENRYLTQRPKFTFSLLFRNEYTPKYEAYINDQFVARDAWITLKSVSETALGKIENNGIVYGGEHHMFEDYRSTDERRLKQNINFINAYFEKYKVSQTLRRRLSRVLTQYWITLSRRGCKTWIRTKEFKNSILSSPTA